MLPNKDKLAEKVSVKCAVPPKIRLKDYMTTTDACTNPPLDGTQFMLAQCKVREIG